MRTTTRIAAALTTGVVATVLMASPGLAANGQPSNAGSQQAAQQVGTCDGTAVRVQDRDRLVDPDRQKDRLFTGDQDRQRDHKS